MASDDVVRGTSLDLKLRSEDEAVSEHWKCVLLDVVRRHEIAARQERRCASDAKQRDRSTWRGAERERCVVARGADEIGDVITNFGRHSDGITQCAELRGLLRRHHGLRHEGRRALGVEPFGVVSEHLDLRLTRRVVDSHVDEKAIELRFGERVRSFVLDRILSREHGEEIAERVGAAVHCDLALLHRLEQGRLRLGRGAIDLVSQKEIGEDRARA